MSEPRLEDSSDYNGLKGSKRKVVYAVVAMIIAIGILLVVLRVENSHVSDEIKVEDLSRFPR